jgi:SET domain-containing protein 6
MQVDDENSISFLEWFKSVGGTLHNAVGITEFPGMSRGAIALQDIEARHFGNRG